MVEPKSARHADLIHRQRRWLDEATRESGITLSELARRSGVATTTLTRFRNDPNHRSPLAVTTMMDIAGAAGLEITPDVLTPKEAPTTRRMAPQSLRETEAAPYKARAEGDIGRAVLAFCGDAGHLVPWELRTRALEDVGILPGDIVVLDLNAAPEPGDLVCAQLYDWANAGQTETLWRVYERPFLVAASRDPGTRKPLLVDGEKVMIKGVIVASFRARRPSSF